MPTPFFLIDTKDLNGNPGVGGGMGVRGLPGQTTMNYIGVPSVEEYITKVKKLGGNIIMPRTAVAGWAILQYALILRIITSGYGRKIRTRSIFQDVS